MDMRRRRKNGRQMKKGVFRNNKEKKKQLHQVHIIFVYY